MNTTGKKFARSKCAFSAVVFAVCFACFLTPARAVERQALHGHVPAVVRELNLQPVGRLPASERLSLVIGLSLRNREGFSNLLQQIYDPGSPQFHRYLTPDQITARFGPVEPDYQSVAAFAETNGLSVESRYADRTLLRVNGTVADIEKAFHLTMRVYPHPTESRTFYAPDAEPSLDLAVPIAGISGLNDYIVPHPAGHVGGPAEAGASATPGGGSAPSGSYWGNDYRAAYVPGTSLTGAGQVVGLLELDGYYASDITTYESRTGLPNVTLTNELIDGFSGTPDSDANSVGEVSLDIEMAISMAPGLSEAIVYESPNCCYYWVDILKKMQEDNVAKQLSSSWLFDYDDPNADTIYKEFAMQGQSFFQCSGDYLAFYNGVSQWTDDANITLVGGTTLSTVSAGGAWKSETVWTNGNFTEGSGGGISASYLGNVPIPSWQQSLNMTTNQGSTVKRNVPDVSMIAYHAWVAWNDGSTGWWWGTSIAAPMWAGFTALANQQAATYGRPAVGFLNPAIYAIGQGPLYASCFHDITTGNNTNSHTTNLFFACPGYDLCTGWGTPAGTNLINVLTGLAGGLPPVLQVVSQANDNLVFTWSAVPGFTYQVQYITNPATANWLNLGSAIVATNSVMSETNAIAPGAAAEFYRVGLLP